MTDRADDLWFRADKLICRGWNPCIYLGALLRDNDERDWNTDSKLTRGETVRVS